MRSRHALAAATSLVATACLALVSAPAGAVIAGHKADHPAVVQIEIHDGLTDDGSPHRCTGTALSDRWVLTAAHCVEGDSYADPHADPSMLKVYYSNDKAHPGPATAVDRYVEHGAADIVLLHLTTSRPLASYPRVADHHAFQPGETATLYGYGKGAYDAAEQPTWLRRATLRATGQEDSLNAGEVTVWRGVDGGSNHGDSGGPVIASDGSLIGVNVISSHSLYPSEVAYSKSVDVTAYRSWVHKVAGV